MAALVFIMTPGVGFFYGGLVRSKHALSTVFLSLISMAVVTLQWFIWGFSLSFSESGSPFIGNMEFAGLRNVGAAALTLTAPAVPGIAFMLYQLMFAAITPALMFGSVAERLRIIPASLFVFVWATLVYNPVAYWTWSARGWLKNLSCLPSTRLGSTPCGQGVYDFAGGGPGMSYPTQFTWRLGSLHLHSVWQ